ncbi:hypothetical protein [Chelativorans alearense]|uniref:hypothetical protein n=1 Tax=Chelativorans alearense TaxID=2681495 RepID=UPI0013D23AF9|nr:hypothetical protein [Chelativorans alearense]
MTLLWMTKIGQSRRGHRLLIPSDVGRMSDEERLRYNVVEAELQQAYYSYLLCADNVGANPLSDIVSSVPGANLQRTNWLVSNAQEGVAHTDTKYGGIETADGIFDVVGVAGVATKIAGKFVVKAGVEYFQTATGTLISKETIDYLKAKGLAFVDDRGGAIIISKGGAPKGTVQIDSGKFDYLFGRVTSNPHNTARSQQLQSELSRVGIYDTPSGRQTLASHFSDVASDPSSVVRTFTETRNGVTQNFIVRESLLPGPGGFVRLETTFETMADGSSRFITTIPYR